MSEEKPPNAYRGDCPCCGHRFQLEDLAWMARGDGFERHIATLAPDGTKCATRFGDFDPCTMSLWSERHLPAEKRSFPRPSAAREEIEAKLQAAKARTALSPEAAEVSAKSHWPACETLPGMRRLPKELWTVQRRYADDLGMIIVGAHAFQAPGCDFESRWYVKLALADLPNDLIDADDMKRLGLVG